MVIFHSYVNVYQRVFQSFIGLTFFTWHTQQSPHEAWSETSLGSPEAQLKAVWRDTVVLPVVGTSKWKSFHKKVQSLYFLLNISSPTYFLEGSILDSRCLIVIGLEWNDWLLRCLASWPLANHPWPSIVTLSTYVPESCIASSAPLQLLV